MTELRWGKTPLHFFPALPSLTKSKSERTRCGIRRLPSPPIHGLASPIPRRPWGEVGIISVDIPVWRGRRWQPKVAVMPMHPVTSTLMYRGICTIPDILSYSAPVNLPEDEVEGEMLPVRVYLRVFEAGEAHTQEAFGYNRLVCVRLRWSSFKQTRGQHLGQRSWRGCRYDLIFILQEARLGLWDWLKNLPFILILIKETECAKNNPTLCYQCYSKIRYLVSIFFQWLQI